MEGIKNNFFNFFTIILIYICIDIYIKYKDILLIKY
jgi:hypothetical protein